MEILRLTRDGTRILSRQGGEGTSNGKVARIEEPTVFSSTPSPENGELKFGELKIEELNLDGLLITKSVVDKEGIATEEIVVNEEDPRYLVAKTYLDFLNDPKNKLHFAHPPKDVKRMIETKEDRDHFLILTRVERVEGNLVRKIVGGARLTDNVAPENEHWASLIVVDPEKQNQGIGHELLDGLLGWARDPEHKTVDGRIRDHIHIGITMGIKGWQAMEKVAKDFDFKLINNLAREMDYWQITYPDGNTEFEQRDPEGFLFGEKLNFHNVPGTIDRALMKNGAYVEVVKLPTRRLGFSYECYLGDDHVVSVWQREHLNEITLPGQPSQGRLF